VKRGTLLTNWTYWRGAMLDEGILKAGNAETSAAGCAKCITSRYYPGHRASE
jgi:hypothetical protein